MTPDMPKYGEASGSVAGSWRVCESVISVSIKPAGDALLGQTVTDKCLE